MTFEIGKCYKTRSGEKVVIVGFADTVLAAKFPVFGVYLPANYGHLVCAWTKEGYWLSDSELPNPHDLISEWQDRSDT